MYSFFAFINVSTTGIIKIAKKPVGKVLTHTVNTVIMVIMNIFIITLVMENEILTIVKSTTKMQYKYFTVSVILMKLPRTIKSKINQPKNPKRTRNVLFKWYFMLFGELMAWNFQLIFSMEPIIPVNPTEKTMVIIMKKFVLSFNS
jgi:membrane-anchored glycerophosphoryl diester phosphodiesterase (GDPDase)